MRRNINGQNPENSDKYQDPNGITAALSTGDFGDACGEWRSINQLSNGQPVRVRNSNSIQYDLAAVQEEGPNSPYGFCANLVLTDVGNYRNMATVPVTEAMENQKDALGVLGSYRRIVGTDGRLLVADDKTVRLTLKNFINSKLVTGALRHASPDGEDPKTGMRSFLKRSLDQYYDRLIRVSDPTSVHEVLSALQERGVKDLELYHCRADLLRYMEDNYDQYGIRVKNGLTSQMAELHEAYGGKVFFRDLASDIWGSVLARTVVRNKTGEIDEKALFADLHSIALKCERKNWDSRHGNRDSDYKGEPVFYEQLDQSAGGFNAKPIYRDERGYLYYVSKESSEQVHFVPKSEQYDHEDKDKALVKSLRRYIDHLQEFEDDVDVAEHGLMKDLLAFSIEVKVTLNDEGVTIERNGVRGNIVINGDYVGAFQGNSSRLKGLNFDRCFDLADKIARDKAEKISDLREYGQAVTFTFGIDFNCVAIPLEGSDEEKLAKKQQYAEKYGTLDSLDEGYALGIMATEDNNRFTALSHWRYEIAQFDKLNNTNILERIDRSELFIAQTDHKALSPEFVEQITQGQAKDADGNVVKHAARNSLTLLKKIAEAGIDVVHVGSKVADKLGIRFANRENNLQGVIITSAPVGNELGIAVVGPNEEYVKEQYRLLEELFGTGNMAQHI